MKPAIETRPPPFSSIVLPAPSPPERSLPSWKLTFKLLERVAKGCTWAGSVLLLIGLACAWRIFLRPEHLTLFGLNFLLLLITRIRYGTFGLDLRYFMPIVIVGVPWMALGLEYLIAAARRLFSRRGELSPRALRILAGSLVAAAVAGSLLDGPMPASAYMRKRAVLGRWIQQHVGPEPAIAGNIDRLSLDTFYAHGHMVGIFSPCDCLLVPMPKALAEQKAEIVVLWNKDNVAPEYLAIIQQRIGYYGYRRVDAQQLPAGEDELMVFVKK